jgi:hypothetical protein
MKKMFCALGLLMLCGCASGPGNNYGYQEPRLYKPSAQEEEAADYGPYPEDYEAIIKNYMQTKLFDPYTAHYRISMKPVKTHLSAKTREEIVYCWHVGSGLTQKTDMADMSVKRSICFISVMEQ